jgi:hypothetical protein
VFQPISGDLVPSVSRYFRMSSCPMRHPTVICLHIHLLLQPFTDLETCDFGHVVRIIISEGKSWLGLVERMYYMRNVYSMKESEGNTAIGRPGRTCRISGS